ncbi:MAG: ComEC/Rec2 family competence protein [Candidatus Paceibacterota bacterium]
MDAFMKWILPPGLGFISGIALISFFDSFDPLFAITLLTASFLAAYLYFDRSNFLLIISISVLTLATLWIGGFYLEKEQTPSKENLEREMKNEWVRVVSDVKLADSNARYTVELKDGSKALMTTSLFPRLSYNTEILISGELQKPPVFKEFDYRTFLKKEGIEGLIHQPQIKEAKEAKPSLKGVLFSVKDNLRQKLRSSLPYPHNTIVGAMILGDSDKTPQTIGDLFSATGIRHIIAISGLHVTIIMGMILVVTSSILRLGRNYSFFTASITIVLFVLFVGAPPSAIRAAIMSLIFLLAFKLGKIYAAWRALFLAAVVMLIFDPMLLFYDVGFQLSFIAMLGILFVTPPIENILGRRTSFLSPKDKTETLKSSFISLLAVSLGAYITTLPLVAYHFNIISFSAPIANLISVPLLPLILISSFSAGLLGTLSELIGQIVAIPAFLGLEIILKIAYFLDSLPISSIEVEIGKMSITITYMIIFSSVFLIRYHHKNATPTNSASDLPLPPENRPF